MAGLRPRGNALSGDPPWAGPAGWLIIRPRALPRRTDMYPTDDEGTARAQALYDRTNQLILGMAEAFHDLWLYADNRAAVKVTDGSTFAVSEITEALRDPLDQI